jgi:hypothetical protein
MDSFAKDQEKKKSALADEEGREEANNELAGLFMNAAKAKPDSRVKKPDVSLETPNDGVVLGLPDREEGEPTIANNAEIQKTLAGNTADKNSKKSEVNPAGPEVDLKIELSDADFSQDPNLNNLKEWATNKRETFPGGKELPQLDDSDDEFEDET